MAYLRIHCDVCGGTWEIYSRDNWKDDKARECPHCFSKIDRSLWDKEIIPAFTAVNDANAELVKDHVGNRRPLFSVDVIANHLYANRTIAPGNMCPLLVDIDPLAEHDDYLSV